MLEPFNTEKLSETSEHNPEDIREDFELLKYLIECMASIKEDENPYLWANNKRNLDRLFAKYGLPTDNLVANCIKMREMAIAAASLSQEI